MTHRQFNVDTLNTALWWGNTASIDPVATVDQKYLMFQFQGVWYMLCLKNGLLPAPRIFTKLMKPVYIIFTEKKGTPSYELFEWLLLGGWYFWEECKHTVINTCDLLIKLEFSIHRLDKSQLIPVQKIEYLGFALDSKSMTVSLTDIKQQNIKTLIDETLQTAKQNT